MSLCHVGGKRYVWGNMLLNLLMFSQWDAKIWSDIHASTHRGSHSLNNNCCILLSDCISWVVCWDQRIGGLGALEMCSWFPLLPDEIWYALLFQISVEFTQGIALVKRLDFYFRKNGLQRDMERNIECQLSAAAMHCHRLVFKLNQFAIGSHIALANHWL